MLEAYNYGQCVDEVNQEQMRGWSVLLCIVLWIEALPNYVSIILRLIGAVEH